MYLITGARGQLGTALRGVLPDAAYADFDELDVADADAAKRFVRDRGIDVIINCAAYTAVDRAEEEPEPAERVNVLGPRNLAATGAKLIHISTDYVFDGESGVPYAEDMAPRPLSVYGRTKLAGEAEALGGSAAAAVVVRTGWLYSPYGGNFLKTMLALGAERDEVRVVSDQVGTPTSAFDLARALAAIAPRLRPELNGVYHYSNQGMCSWFDFAVEIMQLAGLRCRVVPISTGEYPVRATRPAYSVLDKTRITSTFGVVAPHWKEGLRECLKRF